MREVVIITLSIIPFFLSWLFVFDGDEYIADTILHTEINRAD